MRLAVDTGVLVSGTLWRNNTSRLVDALLDGTATLCISTTLLAEFEEVIQREKFRARLAQTGHTAGEMISRLRKAAVVVDPTPIAVPANLRDPDDVHVLACAIASACNAIVAGDKDLLAMKSFAGVPILTVRQALEMLGVLAR